MLDNRSHNLEGEELIKYVTKEVMKYTACYDRDRILHSYRRMTVEEIAQEVVLKILRSPSEQVNKRYIRQAVIYVAIDLARKKDEVDPEWRPQDSEAPKAEGLEITREDTFKETERLMDLKIFEGRELKIMLLLLEGKRNPEIRKELNIPKMSYYTALKRLKEKYVEAVDEINLI